MSPQYSVEGVDQFLRDVTQIDIPFGGKLMILGGDFRQISPVVRGKAAATVEASLKRSKLWPLFKVLKLEKNIRATSDPGFAALLLNIGDGKILEDEHGNIDLPVTMKSNGRLIEEIYGNTLKENNLLEITKRAILCPKNVDCQQLNKQILHQVPGQPKIYYSADTACTEDLDARHYPAEFWSNLTPSGMPPHALEHKVGAMVMLLRNLSVKHGLCNGTRLIVEELNSHSIKCRVVSSNKTVAIPRIDLTEADTRLPFKLCRHQFPLRVCYSITINKSQGQTFDHIGLHLPSPILHMECCMLPYQDVDKLKT